MAKLSPINPYAPPAPAREVVATESVGKRLRKAIEYLGSAFFSTVFVGIFGYGAWLHMPPWGLHQVLSVLVGGLSALGFAIVVIIKLIQLARLFR